MIIVGIAIGFIIGVGAVVIMLVVIEDLQTKKEEPQKRKWWE